MAELRKGQVVKVVGIPDWVARQKELVSRAMTGTLQMVTERAILLDGSALLERAERCHRCGLEIKNPVSLTVGYGPDCSERLGIPRPDVLGLMSRAELDELARQLAIRTRTQVWLPLGRIDVTVLHEAPAAPAVNGNGTHGTPSTAPAAPANTIKVVGKYLVVRSEYQHKDRCKAVPGGRWSPDDKAWQWPASSATAKALQQAFNGVKVEVDQAFTDLIAEHEQQEAKKVAAQQVKLEGELPEIPLTKTAAWKHQVRAFWHVAILWGGLPDHG